MTLRRSEAWREACSFPTEEDCSLGEEDCSLDERFSGEGCSPGESFLTEGSCFPIVKGSSAVKGSRSLGEEK